MRGVTSRRLAVAFVLVGALITAGCLEQRRPLGGQCQLASECDAPLVCRLERCRRQCASARDCPPGALCVEDGQGFGACTLPDEESCERNSGCPAPLMCLGGACRAACATDRDCTPGSLCEEGACVLASERSCVADSECLPPFVCGRDGRCRLECRADRDCRPGDVCEDGTCEAFGNAVDAGGLDAGVMDAGDSDAGDSDAGGSDAGDSDAGPDGGRDGGLDGGMDAGAMLLDGGPSCSGTAFGCPTPDFADAVCVSGSCGYVCLPGFGDCNSDPADGCETSVATNVDHCGACGEACGAATPVCLGECVDATVEELEVAMSTACARWSTGQVTCWGGNRSGEVGVGLSDLRFLTLPIPLLLPGTAIDVDLGSSRRFTGAFRERAHACLVRPGGTVECWGEQDVGQTGQGAASTTPLYAPTPVPGLTMVDEVVTLGRATCARRSDGQVLCWGEQQFGRLGNGMEAQATVPTPTPIASLTDAVALFAGANAPHVCALRSGGAIACWGLGAHGNTDMTSVVSALPESMPVEATALTSLGIDELALGGSTSFGRASGTGAAHCWGRGGSGHCGDGMASTDYLVPQAEADSMAAFAFGDAFAYVRPGGQLMCRGLHSVGQCGLGIADSPIFPAQEVSGLTDVTHVEAGFQLTCIVRHGRRIECTGANRDGQLGDGTTSFTPRQTFAPIQGAPP